MRPYIVCLNLEIHVTTTAEGQALVQAIQALPGKFASAEQSAIDAAKADLQTQLDAANAALAQEKQDHADDLAAASAAVDASAPAA